MIFFLFGKDGFRSYQKLQQIIGKFKQDIDATGLNIEILEGQNVTLDEFSKHCFSAGFLVSKRLIIIKNLLTKRKDKQIHESIFDLIKDANTDNIIVFYEQDGLIGPVKKSKKPTSLRSFLVSTQYAQEFQPLTGKELERWIIQTVQGYDIQISSVNASLLGAHVGSDLWLMHNEIKKLISYVKGDQRQEIIKQDIQMHVKANIDANIFALMDVLGKKNPKQALHLLKQQLQNGDHPLYILTMLIRQIRLFIEVKSYFQMHSYSASAAKTLGMHPFVMKKAYEASQSCDMVTLKRAYKQLQQIDQKTKLGDVNVLTHLDLFVLHM